MRGRDEQFKIMLEKEKKRNENYPSWIMEYFLYMQQNKSPTTVCHYISYLRRFIDYYADSLGKNTNELSNNDIRNITTIFIDEYFIDLKNKEINNSASLGKLSPITQSTYYNAILGFFKMLKMRNYIVEDPFSEKIAKPKVKQAENVVYMTKDEIDILLERIEVCIIRAKSAKSKKKLLIAYEKMVLVLIYLSTGIRKSALTYVNMEDVFLEDGYFIATDKEDKTKKYFLSDGIIDYFKIYLKYREIYIKYDSPATFISSNGTRINPATINNYINELTDNIKGKKITPHKLRHTFGENLYLITKDINQVADALGHYGLGSVRKYVAVDEESRKESNMIMSKFVGV